MTTIIDRPTTETSVANIYQWGVDVHNMKLGKTPKRTIAAMASQAGIRPGTLSKAAIVVDWARRINGTSIEVARLRTYWAAATKRNPISIEAGATKLLAGDPAMFMAVFGSSEHVYQIGNGNRTFKNAR